MNSIGLAWYDFYLMEGETYNTYFDHVPFSGEFAYY